jgi:hypothetical protein
MSGFCSSAADLGGGLIDIENVDVAQFFSSSREEVGADHSVGRHDNANGDSPSDVIDPRPNRSPDELDRLVFRHSHSPAASTRPILPRTNAFKNKCAGITKAIVSSPDIYSRALDKEVLVKGFGHLVGNTIFFQASYRSQHEGEWPHGLSTLGYLQDYNVITVQQAEAVSSHYVENRSRID